jgi:hypothetical protein
MRLGKRKLPCKNHSLGYYCLASLLALLLLAIVARADPNSIVNNDDQIITEQDQSKNAKYSQK